MHRARHSSIRHALDALERAEIVRSWYSYSPGDWRGVRWVIEAHDMTRTLATREAEAFVFGCYAVEAGERAQLVAA